MRGSRLWFGVGLVLMAGAAVFFTACGGDDDDSSSDSPAVTDNSGSGSNSGSNTNSNNSNSGSSASSDDLTELANSLEPPNASEASRFSGPDGVVVGWESSESVDSLKDYYDDKLDDMGLALAGTMDAGENHTWIIEDTGKGIAGGVVVGPGSEGKSIVTVSLTPQ